MSKHTETEFMHADILRAFADGKKVERTFGEKNDCWLGCSFKDYTRWYDEAAIKFRIAPEPKPKPDLVSFAAAIKGEVYTWLRPSYASIDESKKQMEKHPLRGYETFVGFIKTTISGETGKLTVEVVEDES